MCAPDKHSDMSKLFGTASVSVEIHRQEACWPRCCGWSGWPCKVETRRSPSPLILSLRERKSISAVLMKGLKGLYYSARSRWQQNIKLYQNINSCLPLPKGEGLRVRGNSA
jgi:hypothetical protein